MPPMRLSTKHGDMWNADSDLSACEGLRRSISLDLSAALDRECPFLLRWPDRAQYQRTYGIAQDCDRVHKSVELSARPPSRSPEVPEDELYDTEPPPGFKMLKKKSNTRPIRHATTSTNSSWTSARQRSLGDGFSAEEAKPLKEKPESHSKKRKRCDPSPILGTLQVVLLVQPDENVRSKGECGLGSVRRSIIEPLRPRPMEEKETTAVRDVVWLEADETGGPDESVISVACDADEHVAAESETTDEATPVNSGESRQGQGRDRDWDWDWDWDWNSSTTGLPSLR